MTPVAVLVRGVVWPYVAEQAVKVSIYRDGRKVAVIRVPIAAIGNGAGQFHSSYVSRFPGLVQARVAHYATPQQVAFSGRAPAVHFVHQLAESGRPIAVICHGPWTMIDAGLVSGRRFTSWPSLRTDLTNAGADWVDEVVVVDTNGPNTIVSSRKPDDLPRFCEELVHTFSQAFART